MSHSLDEHRVMISLTDKAGLHSNTPLAHNVCALNSLSSKNILYKSHGLRAAVKPELRSARSRCDHMSGSLCACRCALSPASVLVCRGGN